MGWRSSREGSVEPVFEKRLAVGGERVCVEACPEHPSGIPNDNAIRRDVFGDDGSRSDDAALADSNALQHSYPVADPDVAFDDRRLEVWASGEAHREARDVDRMIPAHEGDIGSEQAVVPDRDIAGQMRMPADVDVVPDRDVIWINEETVAASEMRAERPELVAIQSNSKPSANAAQEDFELEPCGIILRVARFEGVRHLRSPHIANFVVKADHIIRSCSPIEPGRECVASILRISPKRFGIVHYTRDGISNGLRLIVCELA